MKESRIGVVSFEHMHALSYTQQLLKYPEVVLVGIADEDEKRGKEMAAKFQTTYYRSYEALLDEQLDGVIICTNNRDHAKVSIAAAKKGLHILVEKPFATTIADAKAMLAAAREAGVQIMNAFPMRFNPNVIAAKKKIDAEFEAAEQHGDYKLDDVFGYMYEELPSELKRQKNALENYYQNSGGAK
jgi:predicted dehydrogenase